jgi:hypothetical protein
MMAIDSPDWPPITDKRSAINLAKCGWITGLVIAGLYSVGILFFDLSKIHLIDVVLALIICDGIFNMSRTAALYGVIYSILKFIYVIIFAWKTTPIWIILCISISMVLFAQALRATDAYHAFLSEERLKNNLRKEVG